MPSLLKVLYNWCTAVWLDRGRRLDTFTGTFTVYFLQPLLATQHFTVPPLLSDCRWGLPQNKYLADLSTTPVNIKIHCQLRSSKTIRNFIVSKEQFILYNLFNVLQGSLFDKKCQSTVRPSFYLSLSIRSWAFISRLTDNCDSQTWRYPVKLWSDFTFCWQFHPFSISFDKKRLLTTYWSMFYTYVHVFYINYNVLG